jgi:transketolase
MMKINKTSTGKRESLNDLRCRLKLRLLRMHYESGVGHIGGNLSCLDILIALYHFVLSDKDHFVLSKGHAAGALYIALWSIGILNEEELQRFHKDGTRLPGHPPAAGITGIEFATGSLGHGLGLAAGLALGKQLKGQNGRVFCLTSDGEWNEGSSWESLIFVKHRNLNNLTVIVDCNGLQGFGTTRDVANLEPFSEKFKAFGLETLEVNGHDVEAVRQALARPTAGPVVVVAKTRKGCGISFMENRLEWHYMPLDSQQYENACEEVKQECAISSAVR